MAVRVCWGLKGRKKIKRESSVLKGRLYWERKGTECCAKELRLPTEGNGGLLTLFNEERGKAWIFEKSFW